MGSREVGAKRDQGARQRRMLGVEFVFALIHQLHAGGQVLGFIPGMTKHPPRTGSEQAGNNNEKDESGADQAPNG